MNIIKRIGEHRILTAKNKQSVSLNFNPLLNSLLTHLKYQENLPAYYCPQTQEYLACEELKIDIHCHEHFWIGIPRALNHGVLPTSMLLYPNAAMVKIDNVLVIDNATQPHQGQASGLLTV
jgi:hypothetical protein